MADTTDDEALERFCTAEHPRLLGLLTLYVGDRGVAEQLAQDALVRLCQHWPRVRRMAHPRGWLTRVALNGATSWSRRRAAERRALARHGPDHEVSPGTDTVTALAVRDALRRLPDRQRRVVVLRFYAGLDVAEAASVLACPEGTVKSLTHRAVARLRDELALAELEDDRVR
ncbi:RNA polymerase sigma factor [Nitriliruptor alkaliphilus]|uniref:RNA polymerase sigma factor n=1 Tax=Nitriliruptor alkaliphilus TaxID=427918 RepID=UPI0006990364|nr:sigma-70 family RNA polymerase sigma factor [Nitriliruptor alkaliphilus]